MITIREGVFSSAELLADCESQHPGMGAVVSFTGKMRDTGETGAKLQSLYLEHYPGMTEQVLEHILTITQDRLKVHEIVVHHRVGEILPDEPIVFVAVIAEHRKAAFDACMMVMDYLKNQAPFWKKEIYLDGSEYWVKQKITDVLAMKHWHSD